MGNWRTVHIVGTCNPKEVMLLREYIDIDLSDLQNMDRFGPLSYCGGIAGLPNWGAAEIDAVGNMAERDYDANDVAAHLEDMAKVAPSLMVKAHIGNAYEHTECVATVTLANGKATVGANEVDDVGQPSQEQLKRNVLEAVRRANRQ